MPSFVAVSGCAYVYKASQPTHPNASVNYIMQTGQQDIRENVLLELIVQLMAEPAFNQLRTTEQLGKILLVTNFWFSKTFDKMVGRVRCV